jgi:mono/diheme cytochrome c family protein
MPLAWMKALEQADSAQSFLSDANMAQFGFLPRTTSFGERLPVGFAIDDHDDEDLSVSKLRWFEDQESDERWIGLNCSACHTAEIRRGSEVLRIEGGPSLVDFQAFIEAVDAALVATRDQPAKWDRFAKAVLGTKDNSANRAMLKSALDSLAMWQRRTEAMNDTPLRYGPARLDAFGHIYNKISMFVGDPNPVRSPADAPVSFPFLWDIYRHDKLQWNGVAQNSRLNLGNGNFLDYGAMGRNTGEVIGVFGDIVIEPPKPIPSLRGYKSSVQAANLDRLETMLRRLRAPKWPSSSFDNASDSEEMARRRSEGQELFRAKCQSCHGVFEGTAPYKVTMVPLRAPARALQEPLDLANPTRDAMGRLPNLTDPWMACNAYTYSTRSGRLAGTPEGYISGSLIKETAPIATLLATTVKGALIGKKGPIVKEAATTFLGIERPPRVVTDDTPTPEERVAARLLTCLSDDNPLLAYKARPLDGIWATAPYLHNGSVPTLYHLLLPPGERPVTFKVGTRNYDPRHVGYEWGDAPGNSFLFDTRLKGNSNGGHDYGASRLTPDQRWALVEYMKTL